MIPLILIIKPYYCRIKINYPYICQILNQINFMKNSYFFSIAIAAALLINCKGKDGAPGPAGMNGVTGPIGPMPTEENYVQPKEGFFKAALTANFDGMPTTINLDFQGGYTNASTYTVISDTLTSISLVKYYSKDGEQLEQGYIRMTIYVKNIISLENPRVESLNIWIEKLSSTNKLLKYNFFDVESSFQSEKSSYKITNLKFVASTSTITGNLTATLNDDDGLKTKVSTITNGSFSSKLIQSVSNTRKSN